MFRTVFAQYGHMARPEIVFLTAQYVPRCTHQIDKHFSDYQTLQYMHTGRVSLAIDQQAYALSGRWFWSCYPGPRIAFHASEPGATWVHRYVSFRGPLVTRWMEDGLYPIAPQRSPGDRDYSKRFDDVLSRVREGGRWNALRAGHLIEGLLIELAESRSASPQAPAWVQDAQVSLARQATGAIHYDQLADALGMSERSLRRNFRKRLGISPHQYVIDLRIRAARDLLTHGDAPLKEIARRLGYNDVFYFGRQFKAQVGVSPAQFRRSREG